MLAAVPKVNGVAVAALASPPAAVLVVALPKENEGTAAFDVAGEVTVLDPDPKAKDGALGPAEFCTLAAGSFVSLAPSKPRLF